MTFKMHTCGFAPRNSSSPAAQVIQGEGEALTDQLQPLSKHRGATSERTELLLFGCNVAIQQITYFCSPGEVFP